MNPHLTKTIRSLLKEPIGILGYGAEGQSTCRFLLQCGFTEIMVFDQIAPDTLPENVVYAGDRDYLSRLNEVNTLFRSPGIRPDGKEITAYLKTGGNLTSQTELFFQIVSPENIIGVTGTLGKGTCCTVLHNMFEEAGIAAVAGGNIGLPALDILESCGPRSMIILELSSFQLSTLRSSPRFAIVLRTSSEHLDWHTSQEEYWKHKANLVRFQQKQDLTVYCGDSAGAQWIAEQSGGRKTGYGSKAEVPLTWEKWSWNNLQLSCRELNVKGHFNLENIAAAGITAKAAGVPDSAILKAAKAFKGLEHRLEYAGKNDRLTFYNDSYATRPEATMAAIASFPHDPLGLILGGSEKYIDFSAMTHEIVKSRNISAIALMGETAERINRELKKSGGMESIVVQTCENLEGALGFLVNNMHKGIILLSPACASFGLFRNYKERGQRFKELVKKLITRQQE
jgi:UDP-N-acetylmuramoylalanine--D-glutamate ligase